MFSIEPTISFIFTNTFEDADFHWQLKHCAHVLKRKFIFTVRWQMSFGEVKAAWELKGTAENKGAPASKVFCQG